MSIRTISISLFVAATTAVATPASADAAAPNAYFYSYFKQPLPLKLDTGRIAVQQRAADPAAAPDADLAAFGIAAADQTAWPIAGWSLANVPAASRDDAGIRGLVGRIAAEAGGLEFVSPVFLDEYGPVIITPDLLVGFEHGVTREQAEAILQQAAPGTVRDVDYSRMKDVYRFRSASKNGFEVLDAANALAQRAEVRFAEPDMIRTARMAGTMPNDPFFEWQWGLHNTGQNIFEGLSQLCCSAPCTGSCIFPCPDLCLSAGAPLA